MGEIDVITYQVPINLNNQTYDLVCGSLPDMLGLTLSMLGIEGILGNGFMKHQQVAYLPRRNQIVLI